MKKIITFFVSLVILSCSEERTANEAKLVESEKQIRIDIDDNTNIYTGTLLYHVDKATGNKYIVIHNDRNNFRHSINFYNIQTSELESVLSSIKIVSSELRTQLEGILDMLEIQNC